MSDCHLSSQAIEFSLSPIARQEQKSVSKVFSNEKDEGRMIRGKKVQFNLLRKFIGQGYLE